jgi:hypothetical protein
MRFQNFFTSFKDIFGFKSVTGLLLYAHIPLSDRVKDS